MEDTSRTILQGQGVWKSDQDHLHQVTFPPITGELIRHEEWESDDKKFEARGKERNLRLNPIKKKNPIIPPAKAKRKICVIVSLSLSRPPPPPSSLSLHRQIRKKQKESIVIPTKSTILAEPQQSDTEMLPNKATPQ